MVLRDFVIWYDEGSGEYFYDAYAKSSVVRKRADGVREDHLSLEEC